MTCWIWDRLLGRLEGRRYRAKRCNALGSTSAEVAVYLDSSALVKLVVAEPESAALRRFLRRHPRRVSSALARVEVPRAVRLQGAPALDRAGKVLARVGLIRVDDELLAAAAALDPKVLRSLDAVHLASAQAAGELACVVTYDRRMSAAAGILGLHVRCPGAPDDQRSRRKRAVGASLAAADR